MDLQFPLIFISTTGVLLQLLASTFLVVLLLLANSNWKLLSYSLDLPGYHGPAISSDLIVLLLQLLASTFLVVLLVLPYSNWQ